MKKLNRVASLVTVAAVAAVASSSAFAQAIDNWRSTDGTVWKNGTNEYCWRDNFWTPATAKGCDGEIKEAPKPPPPRRRHRRRLPPPPPSSPPLPSGVGCEKVTFAADAFLTSTRRAQG